VLARSHALTGAATYLLVAPRTGLLTTAAGATVCAAAALLPDLDHPNSTVARSFPGGRVLARIVADLTGGHRGLTHTLPAVALAYALALLAPGPSWLPLAIGLGWAVHIAGDLLTCGGVPLWWPLSRRRVSLPLCGRTGGMRESVLAVAMVVVGVGGLLSTT
jgi:inner membrane protein